MKSLRFTYISLLILAGFLLSPGPALAQVDEGIRIDVPSDALVHVDNRFGNVVVEVWPNAAVTVSATVSDSTPLSRSPILLDNRGKQLFVSAVRSPKDQMAINLLIRLPNTARLEVTTISGRISVNGLSRDAKLKTVSGEIEAWPESQADLNIQARTMKGVAQSDIASSQSGSHAFDLRLGSGAAQVSLQSDSGNIFVKSAKADNVSADRNARAPQLTGVNNTERGAGTPDNRPSTDEIGEGDIIRVDSQLATVNTSVVDRGTNRGMVGLTRSEFKLFEDGEQQVIENFQSSSAPFDLVLLIDLSGSTKEKVKLIREAALHFVNAARAADRIAVVTFAGKAALVSDFTLDRHELQEKISQIDTSAGDTKLYDATEFVMKEVLKNTKQSRRSALVLMSDGLDGTIPGVSGQEGSKTPYADVLRDIQEFDGVFYTLWLNTRYVAMDPRDTQPEAFDEGHDRMKEMAEVGGGVFYEVQRLEDLSGAYERVVDDLGTLYSLAYKPSNKVRDGKWRSIKIVIDRPNSVARGKRGYYAN